MVLHFVNLLQSSNSPTAAPAATCRVAGSSPVQVQQLAGTSSSSNLPSHRFLASPRMRARFLAGMLYSARRHASRGSLQSLYGTLSSTQRFGWSRRGISSGTSPSPITQRIKFAAVYEDEEDLICPVRYFKETVQLLTSLDGNDLLKAAKVEGKSMVSAKAGRTLRTLIKIMLDNMALGIPLGECLRLGNLRISRSKGEFVMLEPPMPPYAPGNLLGDFVRGADIIEELAKKVLGPDVAFPPSLVDFLNKMRESNPRVELIVYHTIFWPPKLLYCLRMLVDQRFRKDFDSLKQRKVKDAIRAFIKELGRKRVELAELVKTDQFIRFVESKSRVGSKNRQGRSNSNLEGDDAVWKERGRDVIAVNRDGVAHGSKQDLDSDEENMMPDIRRYWRTHENIIQLFHVQFEGLEQCYLDLCYESCQKSNSELSEKEKKLLWRFLGIEEFFGETEDTWKAAIDAVTRAAEPLRAQEINKGH